MEAICAKLIENVSKLAERFKNVEFTVSKLAERLDIVEFNLAKLLPKKKKRKRRVEKRVPQNLGCVRTGQNFVDASFHYNREARLKTNLNRLDASYAVYVNAWLKIPQNQSFYRQSRPHSYTHCKKVGWERVKPSYLLEKLSKITKRSFINVVKSINPKATQKDFEFKFPKAKMIKLLLTHSDALKKSKAASRATYPQEAIHQCSAPCVSYNNYG